MRQDGPVLETSPDDIDLAPNLDVRPLWTFKPRPKVKWPADGIKHRTRERVVTSFPIHLSKSLYRSELAHFNFVQEQKLLWYDIPSERTSTEECPWRFDGAPCTYAHHDKWLRWSLVDSRWDRKKNIRPIERIGLDGHKKCSGCSNRPKTCSWYARPWHHVHTEVCTCKVLHDQDDSPSCALIAVDELRAQTALKSSKLVLDLKSHLVCI